MRIRLKGERLSAGHPAADFAAIDNSDFLPTHGELVGYRQTGNSGADDDESA